MLVSDKRDATNLKFDELLIDSCTQQHINTPLNRPEPALERIMPTLLHF